MEEFTPDTSPQKMGEFIALVCRWRGDKITAAFLEALTEANFHTLRAQLEPVIFKHLEE